MPQKKMQSAVTQRLLTDYLVKGELFLNEDSVIDFSDHFVQ